MIEVKNVSKSFDSIKAVSKVSVSIREDQVFGLVGTNGAGKSTLLRMMAGVVKADSGTIEVDEAPIYGNPQAKSKLFFIPDEPYYIVNSCPRDMKRFYQTYYPQFNTEKFDDCLKAFGLDEKRRINTFSKGMKKQLAVLLGICAGTKYLYCDETFDGLDPVMRQAVKSMFAREMADRGLTPIIASHNLRELEDICDHVGLLHQGGVLLSKDLEDMKCSIQKVQCVFRGEAPVLNALCVIKEENRGSLHIYTVRGVREDIEAYFRSCETVFFEILPLSLEEIFISETEVTGYDVKKIIFG